MSIGLKSGGALLGLLWLAGVAGADEAERMYMQASALSKLARAVQATVYRAFPDDLSEPVLLYVATRDDRSLLEPFSGYTLRVRREGRLTSVLLCDGDASRRLIEDAACTGKIDRHDWRDAAAPAPCAFVQPLGEICAP